MLKYLLDTEAGKLRVEKEKSGSVRAGGEEQEIWLMTLEEFKALDGIYPHRKNLCRSMNPVQYCKIESFSDCTQGTMKVPKGNLKKMAVFSFGFYMKENHLVLIDDGEMLKGLLDKLKSNTYGKCRLNQFLLILFELLIEDDVLNLQKLEESLSKVEEELLRVIPDRFYETIMGYRKKLSALHAYYEQLMDIGDLMQANINQELEKEECAAWQHYGNRAERLHNHVEALREYLVQIRELYQSQIDVQQNKVMTFLTIVTTIFLPLSLIAGWYGMNFPGMPEFRWKYGYPVVIAAGILIIVIEILYFKKKKML